MKVKYYQDRTEFQSRGKALILCIFHKYKQIDFTGNAHIHGSAWSDFEKLEKIYPGLELVFLKLKERERIKETDSQRK